MKNLHMHVGFGKKYLIYKTRSFNYLLELEKWILRQYEKSKTYKYDRFQIVSESSP